MISKEAAAIASQCRHYAMCKIDFLGTGICPPGADNHYVSYYPQGRMDLYAALAANRVPMTERLVDIADTCNLCGICDKQCHFVTELRPMKVMKALKEYVEENREGNNPVVKIEDDEVLKQFKNVVGQRHATNDPAVLVTYANDPCPVSGEKMPKYVVLPGTKEETAEIVSICARYELPFAVRGNGSSVIGIVMSEGVVMDMNRMKGISIDKDNWRVDIGAGVTAFDLQKEVHTHGFRVNSAEPSALVCSNIMCSGILSTFSNAYGTGADNYVDAEFVSNTGEPFTLNDKNAPNLFGFEKQGAPPPGICTGASIKLHPTTNDEEGIAVPFFSFEEAAAFCRELGMRRIGISIALLGGEYISTFMSPTAGLAAKLKPLFEERLGIRFMVLVIGDKYAVEAIKKMAATVIDNKLLQLMMMSLPQLIENDWLDILTPLETDGHLYEIFCKEEIYPLLETVLTPSPENIGAVVPGDLRDFYTRLYARPEMTDPGWINTFRILSSRMGRFKHVVAFIGYVPLDKVDVITEMNAEFKRIGDKFDVKNDYGFLTPLDFGKRAILEYDYYIDHTDPAEIQRVQQVMAEAMGMIEKMSKRTKGIQWINTILFQGFSRKENFLYM
ncbi:MAG: FAD-binding protein [bacterium]|nr:FAD-binding protein [bacterium]